MSRRPTLETLHRDEYFHAIYKPPGMATVSERWRHDLPTVIEELWKVWKREDPEALKPHVVHRLDKDTTGVLVFACHRDAQVHLREQFRERTTEKSYLALVTGHPDPASGTIEIEIKEDPRKPGRMVQRRGGKQCETRYEVIERVQGLSLVRLWPRQGRTHQIRISLQAIGHPCAVDLVYGGDGDGLYLSMWKRKYTSGRGRAERPLIGRLTLHAERLTLTHPGTEERMTIEAPLPKDFASTLKQLRKWAPL